LTLTNVWVVERAGKDARFMQSRKKMEYQLSTPKSA